MQQQTRVSDLFFDYKYNTWWHCTLASLGPVLLPLLGLPLLPALSTQLQQLKRRRRSPWCWTPERTGTCRRWGATRKQVEHNRSSRSWPCLLLRRLHTHTRTHTGCLGQSRTGAVIVSDRLSSALYARPSQLHCSASVKVWTLVIAPLTWVRLVTTSALHTHRTLFTKAWQIQSIDISVRKENNYIYTNKK